MEPTDDDEGEDVPSEDEKSEDEKPAEGDAAPQEKKPRRRKRGGKKETQVKPERPDDSIVRSVLTAKMKKTRMCDFHKQGRCKYGTECAFAHDESELTSAPDLRKTRLCRAFLQGGCNDKDCKFAHGESELRATDICFKTALCTWFEKGNCQSGAACRFAHGEAELREDPDAQAAMEARAKRQREGLEDDGGARKRIRTGSKLCPRCHSTMATALGITTCVLCRY
mmetsp:Transcript_57792/g.102601  ORF Transcript_57792/g.102601 Transcript_57792/m.102601 type:complete len:225 (+) Transcript_57792:77-751(+)